MAVALSLTQDQSKSMIYASEHRLDHEGRNPGHTIERHINISRDGLLARMDDGPGENDHNPIFWRSAFLSVDSAALVLSHAIASLGALPVVADFANQANGAFISEVANVDMFWCRDQRGRFPACQVKLFARKVASYPHGLHLITVYPVMRF